MDGHNIKKVIFACGIFLFFFAAGTGAEAADIGQGAVFNVDKNFDASARSQITSVLVKTSPKLYFYVEKNWWDLQAQAKKDEILTNLDSLSEEFNNKIYPILTSMFGSEWNPGVDGDSRTTILFESMNSNEGGYFRTADEYIKLQLPDSNEKEMLYLAINYIDDLKLKVFLAHEFMHLITFNQKNKMFGVEDDIWLNEARADYSSTILGYDNPYEGSNLQRRVKDFIENPSDSVTEWSGTKYDYASASLFTHFLADHYGVGILIDSLKSKYTGIDSLNFALKKYEEEDNFSQIFTNWTIASTVNDCSLSQDYCYLNTNLTNFRLAPSLNFLPLQGNVSLSVTNVTKNWTGNWLKFIGGNGNLKLDFSSLKGLSFEVPYIVENKKGNYSIKFLELDKDQKGEISIDNFGTDFKSLVIIPSLQTKLSGFDGAELTYPYTYKVTIAGTGLSGEDALIQQLLDQIDYLKKEIARLQNQGNPNQGSSSCSRLNSNLSPGTSNNNDVKCLQQFLKNQGNSIYPEGLITGYFGNLTKQAVIRFQEKYKSEILTPIGLQNGTGIVGEKTRAKINTMLF